ncbi:Crotonobetainyl-CoA dehydrogenase [Variovorax sp. SRS16]|uniref:acyl-CoA dehydrogenase family protein n=1 Tax=Variovorax sp. SRS16 TaxID=282217 RepID=UPI001316D72B|nr:acyl-CoA dehydrogenase family protein [Variovorax sp. SRS16]VTU26183.1 Crotonobetainyl-CoA dehydrogenase [Variovorax sp. SRS16]
MTESTSDLFERSLAQMCQDGRIRAVESGEDSAEAASLWADVDALGFTDALVADEHGGAGLSLAEAGPLFAAAGRAGLPHPFGETMVARALLAAAGQKADGGCIAVASALPEQGDAVACREVPGAMLAGHVLVQWRDAWLLMPCDQARVQPGSYRPRASASLQWESARQAVARWTTSGPSAMSYCNAVHAAAMSGAMERVLALSVTYANDRRQFGRAIGQFQAVQQDLAVMAEQAGSAAFAARMGCGCAGPEPDALLAAAAKLRASEAALRVANLAHAVFGAIGITEEHVLGVFTTRLHEWRAAAGTELACAERIGRAALQSGQTLSAFVQTSLAPFVAATAA